MTRFWHCSPVATPIGATARAIVAWPSTSSGLVGSSIHHGSNARELAHPGDRLVDVPHLIGVHHQLAVGPDLLADERRAAHVVGEVAPRP